MLVELCDWGTGILVTVFLFLDADDVGRALISGEQIFAIPSIEKFRQCFDAANDEKEIVFLTSTRSTANEIVPRADRSAVGLQTINVVIQ